MHRDTFALVLGLLVAVFFNVYFIVLIARIPRSVRSVAAQLDRMNASLDRRYPPPPVDEPLTRATLDEHLAVLDVRRARGVLSEDDYAFQRRRLEARVPAPE